MATEYNPKTDMLLDEEEKKRQAEIAAAIAQQQEKDNEATANAAAVEAAAQLIQDNTDNSLPEGVTSPHQQPTTEAKPDEVAKNEGEQASTPVNSSVGETEGENNGVGTSEDNTIADDDAVGKTKQNLDAANADYIQAVTEANQSRNKSFAEIVNDYYERMKTEEAQMKQEETADRFATVATGATELAAGIINMLGVGELHASNQQYHSYSQDWMKKAEDNIREHRNRRANMQDVLQRLKMQQEDLRTSSKIEEAKLKAQQAQAAYNDALAAQKTADDAEEKAWKRGVTEKELGLKEEAQAASIAATKQNISQDQQKINLEREKWETTMKSNGWVRDKKAEGGWRYDPVAAGVNVSNTTRRSSGSGSDSRDAFPVIDSNGEVNIAYLRPHEVEYLMSEAKNAILKDLGAEEAAQFDKEYKRVGDDKARSTVLKKWMGKSPTCESIIKKMDQNYKAQTGYARSFTNTEEEEEKEERYIDQLRNSQTGLGGYK